MTDITTSNPEPGEVAIEAAHEIERGVRIWQFGIQQSVAEIIQVVLDRERAAAVAERDEARAAAQELLDYGKHMDSCAIITDLLDHTTEDVENYIHGETPKRPQPACTCGWADLHKKHAAYAAEQEGEG